MAKKNEYVTDDELTNAVSQLLSNVPQLQALRDNEVVILCCMKVRMDDDGETEPPKGSPVKLKKLSDLERLFVEGNATNPVRPAFGPRCCMSTAQGFYRAPVTGRKISTLQGIYSSKKTITCRRPKSRIFWHRDPPLFALPLAV